MEQEPYLHIFGGIIAICKYYNGNSVYFAPLSGARLYMCIVSYFIVIVKLAYTVTNLAIHSVRNVCIRDFSHCLSLSLSLSLSHISIVRISMYSDATYIYLEHVYCGKGPACVLFVRNKICLSGM